MTQEQLKDWELQIESLSIAHQNMLQAWFALSEVSMMERVDLMNTMIKDLKSYPWGQVSMIGEAPKEVLNSFFGSPLKDADNVNAAKSAWYEQLVAYQVYFEENEALDSVGLIRVVAKATLDFGPVGYEVSMAVDVEGLAKVDEALPILNRRVTEARKNYGDLIGQSLPAVTRSAHDATQNNTFIPSEIEAFWWAKKKKMTWKVTGGRWNRGLVLNDDAVPGAFLSMQDGDKRSLSGWIAYESPQGQRPHRCIKLERDQQS